MILEQGKWRRGRHHGLPWDPRAFNYHVREILERTENGRVLLGTTFFRAHRRNDAIESVDAFFGGRHLNIKAGIFIDATADGDLCVEAGCDYHMGEDPRSLYAEPSAPDKAEMSLNGLTPCQTPFPGSWLI